MTKVSPEPPENENGHNGGRLTLMVSNVHHLEDDKNSIDSDSKSEIDLEANSSSKDTTIQESKVEGKDSEKEALNKEQNSGQD